MLYVVAESFPFARCVVHTTRRKSHQQSEILALRTTFAIPISANVLVNVDELLDLRCTYLSGV